MIFCNLSKFFCKFYPAVIRIFFVEIIIALDGIVTTLD